MSGLLRTVQLLLGWSRFARMLLIGAVLVTAVSLGANVMDLSRTWRDGFTILAILGAAIALISPILMSGVVFRSLSAPRAVALIAYGRLKLLLGALTTQLLLAAFVGVVCRLINPEPPIHSLFAITFIGTFAILTLQFIGSYLTSQLRFGGLWFMTWVFWPQSVTPMLRYWHLQAPPSTPIALGGYLAVCLTAWLIFARSYLRARQIRPAVWVATGTSARTRTFAPADHRLRDGGSRTQAQAILLLITGASRAQRIHFLRALLILLTVLALQIVSLGFHSLRGIALILVGLLCMSAGPLAGTVAATLARRARPLWLNAGMGRAELFREIESRSGRAVLAGAAACLLLATTSLIIGIAPSAGWTVAMLSTPLVSGALFVYAQLQYVRGRRPLDVLFLGACILLWVSEFFCATLGAEVHIIVTLLAVQAVLILPMRSIARRHWLHIDWMVYRYAAVPGKIA